MLQGYDPLASVQAAGPPGTISFVYGLPAAQAFPAADLRRAADRVLRQRPELALQYGPEQGYGPVIDQIRDRLARHEGLVLERPQVMLSGGASQALDHLCLLFTRPGDTVLVEAPTYHETLQLLFDHGLHVLQVATDEGGLQPETLAQRLEALAARGARLRLLYTIPNFQNPSGVTLAADRRQAVIELARRYDLLVVEDDVYRDLTYGDPPPPSLFALDGGECVLRLGSFSKILAPGLRLGWLLAAPDRIQRVVESGLRCMGGGANPLVANILADYVAQGLLEPHIDGLRALYAERRDVMLAALEAHMPPGVSWTRPGGGFFTWLRLPDGLQARQVVALARERGLIVLPGDPFFAERPPGPFLRLAFSYVAPAQIEEGIRTLAGVVADAPGSSLETPGSPSAHG
jgi:2-aminoadipate transaminase